MLDVFLVEAVVFVEEPSAVDVSFSAVNPRALWKALKGLVSSLQKNLGGQECRPDAPWWPPLLEASIFLKCFCCSTFLD